MASKKKTNGLQAGYGYAPKAKITVDKSRQFRGIRQSMYLILIKSDGKTVEHFNGKAREFLDNLVTGRSYQSTRWWLRDFAGDKVCKITGGKV